MLSWADLLTFPTAEMLEAAASWFPASAAAYRFSRATSDVYVEGRTDREGGRAFLRIGPGMVQFLRRDEARAERSRVRAADARALAGEMGSAFERYSILGPMVFAPDGGGQSVPVGAVAPQAKVSGWSSKSRARLIRTVMSLDLAPLVTGAVPPCMITLTLPGEWEAVLTEDGLSQAEVAAAAFHRFTASWRSKWGAPLACIWKREFQKRGAPHWHLWLVPPVPLGEMEVFRSWLSAAWVRSCRTAERAGPDEARRHRAAGTGVDFAEGLRARDPKRLAVYFLKESGTGEGKAYQNEPPASWGSDGVGRYWGVRGIGQAVVEVELPASEAHRVWRAMRRLLERSGPPVVRLVPRGFDPVTGEVRYRRVTRRRRVRQGAGWVAVNDGASYATRLAGVLG